MSRKWWFLVGIGLFVLVLDQWSKFMAVKHLTPGLDGVSGAVAEWSAFYGEVQHPCRSARADCPTLQVVDGFWYWRYVENPGAAWGFLRDAPESVRVPFFFLVSVAAIIFIIAFFRRLQDHQYLTIVALSLVFGGAVGNFIDRIHLNYVIDFIDWFIGTYHWPTFNVADSAISCGVVLLLLEWIRDAIRGSGTETSAEKAG